MAQVIDLLISATTSFLPYLEQLTLVSSNMAHQVSPGALDSQKLLPIAGVYGIITSASLFLLAPFIVPLMLGKEYLASVEVLQWLAPIHLISYIQLLAADVLTGAGFQGYRSAIQVTSALLNLSLNLWLIPLFSWKGAASATLTSETLKTLGFWLVIVFLYRRQSVASKHHE